jgi:hypothetical protein
MQFLKFNLFIDNDSFFIKTYSNLASTSALTKSRKRPATSSVAARKARGEHKLNATYSDMKNYPIEIDKIVSNVDSEDWTLLIYFFHENYRTTRQKFLHFKRKQIRGCNFFLWIIEWLSF